MDCYKIELDATNLEDRNLLLLEAEVKYALMQDYQYICDVNNTLYSIYETEFGVSMNETDEDDKDLDADDLLDQADSKIATPSLATVLYKQMHKIASRPALMDSDPDTLLKLMDVYTSAYDMGL